MVDSKQKSRYNLRKKDSKKESSKKNEKKYDYGSGSDGGDETSDYESEEDRVFVTQMQLLTTKSIIYVCNIDEDSVIDGNQHTEAFLEAIKNENAETIFVSAAIEADIAELDNYEERMEFL